MVVDDVMTRTPRLILFRLLPVLLLIVAAMFYAASIERTDAYLWRNFMPMLAVLILALVTLLRGHGAWTGSGWRLPLGTIGFAIPALGLSMYLHYGYSIDLNGMVSASVYPQELFRFLPLYTGGAGIIGFAIGWIVGKNI